MNGLKLNIGKKVWKSDLKKKLPCCHELEQK